MFEMRLMTFKHFMRFQLDYLTRTSTNNIPISNVYDEENGFNATCEVNKNGM